MDHKQRASSPTVIMVQSPWIPEEDAQLRYMVQLVGTTDGQTSPCRSRADHSPYSPHTRTRQSSTPTIARLLNERSDNAVKNRWNATLKKKHSGHSDLGQNDTVLERNAARAVPQVTNKQMYPVMMDGVSRMMKDGGVPTKLSLFELWEEREGGELAVMATVAEPVLAAGIEFTDFLRELDRQEMMGLLGGDGRPSVNITGHAINEGFISRFI